LFVVKLASGEIHLQS